MGWVTFFSPLIHCSVKPVSKIAGSVSWNKIWGGALDHGVKCTIFQAILMKFS